MKKLLLTIQFLFGIISFSFSQGDFAPIGAEWHIKYDSDGQQNSGYILKKSIKDTTINGMACRQVESMRYSRKMFVPNSGIDTAGPFYGYFYSNPDTVFYYNFGLDTFLPLYIFNVNIGDTMIYHVSFFDSNIHSDTFFRLVVTDITDTVINGKTLRTIHNTPLDDWSFDGGPGLESYTELLGCKIGSGSHFYGDHTGMYFPNEIRCYSDTNITYVANTSIPCDYIPPAYSSIGGINPKDLGITLFPNPATDYFKIEKLSATIEIKDITIKDITGRVVKNLKPTSSNHYKISDLTAGMYIVEIATQEGRGYLKLYKR